MARHGEERAGRVSSTWKVGDLARLTGLTVRALHHYDAIGVLRPSARTPSGHRLYDEDDVRRLYRLVALRGLGVPLEEAGALLAGELDLADLLRDQLAHVERQLAAVRALRDRLAALVVTARSAAPSPTDLLDLVEGMTTMDETISRYFTPEQLEALGRRREELGEGAIADVQAQWPQLIAQVQAELDAGTDPADERVRPLARRWMELLESFHGGDPGLRDSLYRLQADNGEAIRAQYGGPTPELIDYISRANAAAG